MARPAGQPNFKTLIRDELVTRFENVIVDEIKAYKDNVDKVDCEIKEIRDLVDEVISHVEFEKKYHRGKHCDVEDKLKETNESIEDSCFDQNLRIHESIEDIGRVKKRVLEGLDSLSTKQEIVDFKESILKELCEVKQFIVDKDRAYTEKLYGLFEEKEKIFHEFLFMYKHELEEFKKEISKLSADVDIYKVDAAGIHREMDVFKKDLFIIEKKIENLYTLIDRQKR